MAVETIVFGGDERMNEMGWQLFELHDSAFLAILCVDLIVGLIVYKIATESAVARVESGREQFLDALSKGKELVGQ